MSRMKVEIALQLTATLTATTPNSGES